MTSSNCLITPMLLSSLWVVNTQLHLSLGVDCCSVFRTSPKLLRILKRGADQVIYVTTTLLVGDEQQWSRCSHWLRCFSNIGKQRTAKVFQLNMKKRDINAGSNWSGNRHQPTTTCLKAFSDQILPTGKTTSETTKTNKNTLWFGLRTSTWKFRKQSFDCDRKQRFVSDSVLLTSCLSGL